MIVFQPSAVVRRGVNRVARLRIGSRQPRSVFGGFFDSLRIQIHFAAVLEKAVRPAQVIRQHRFNRLFGSGNLDFFRRWRIGLVAVQRFRIKLEQSPLLCQRVAGGILGKIRGQCIRRNGEIAGEFVRRRKAGFRQLDRTVLQFFLDFRQRSATAEQQGCRAVQRQCQHIFQRVSGRRRLDVDLAFGKFRLVDQHTAIGGNFGKQQRDSCFRVAGNGHFGVLRVLLDCRSKADLDDA